MKKLLRPRDILLLGLTHALDAFEEIKDPFNIVSKSYENMYGWVPEQYKKHHFNHLIWRTLKAGYIEKIEKNGEIYIRITSQGEKMVQRDFPLLRLQNKPWDGKWRIVMFDISDTKKKERDYLRLKLKELGFGMFQESVFITPHDILRDFSEYVENIGLKEFVDILEASYILGDQKELVKKIWNLDQLNELYLEIYQKTQKIKNDYLIKTRCSVKQLNAENKEKGVRGVKIKELRTKEIKELKMKELRRLRMKYLDALLRDPFLPSELLPKDYCRGEAGRQIRELFRI